MNEIVNKIVYEPWPWWVGGPLIGGVAILLVLTTRKQLGISSSYQYICSKVSPFRNDYLRGDTSGFSWQFIFVIGMIVGGLLLSFILGDVNVDISDETKTSLIKIGLTDLTGFVPSQLFNFSAPSVLVLLLGGVTMGFGARYANGCTAGHAIAGCAQLSPSSLIATVCFFIGGLAATYFIVPLIFEP